MSSVIVYSEVLAGAHIGHHDENVVRGFFERYITLHDVDQSIAERAAFLRAAATTRKFQTPDAVTLATAERHGAALALTGDRDWDKVRDVRVAIEQLH